MFRFIKLLFIGLLSFSQPLASMAKNLGHANNASLIDCSCITRPSLINLNPDEYSQGLRYYSFSVKINRCNGSCNTSNDFLNRICVPNKTEDIILHVFSTTAGINQKHYQNIICYCKFKFDSIKLHLNQNCDNQFYQPNMSAKI